MWERPSGCGPKRCRLDIQKDRRGRVVSESERLQSGCGGGWVELWARTKWWGLEGEVERKRMRAEWGLRYRQQLQQKLPLEAVAAAARSREPTAFLFVCGRQQQRKRRGRGGRALKQVIAFGSLPPPPPPPPRHPPPHSPLHTTPHNTTLNESHGRCDQKQTQKGKCEKEMTSFFALAFGFEFGFAPFALALRRGGGGGLSSGCFAFERTF
jgi:hypothetical protein